MTLRYRLETPSLAVASPSELALRTAERVATSRTTRVELTDPSWLSAWGVEGAAVAAYAVPETATREDVFVLVRQQQVYVVVWTYPATFIEEPTYACFASVTEATMVWDTLRWEQRGRVWPASTLVGPGLHPQPTRRLREWTDRVGAIANHGQTSGMPERERATILEKVSNIVTNVGAPWVELRRDIIDSTRRSLVNAFTDPWVRASLYEIFAEVKTAHDLRGLAIQIGRTLDPERSAPPPGLRAPHVNHPAR